MRALLALFLFTTPSLSADWCPAEKADWIFRDDPPGFVVGEEKTVVPIDTDGHLYQTWSDDVHFSGSVEYDEESDTLVMHVAQIRVGAPVILERCPGETGPKDKPEFIRQKH